MVIDDISRVNVVCALFDVRLMFLYVNCNTEIFFFYIEKVIFCTYFLFVIDCILMYLNDITAVLNSIIIVYFVFS